MRKQVRMRDGNRCVVCGATERLSVHHIIPAREGGKDVLSNLTTLCVVHHRRADAARRARPAGGDKFAEAEAAGAFEDHPERGIYWGPPDENGRHTRWSRPWHDWRSK